MLITGDGATIVAPTAISTTHTAAKAHSQKGGSRPSVTTTVAITKFSVSTGKPVLVLDRQRARRPGLAGVQWVSASGTLMIVNISEPAAPSGVAEPVIGIQNGATFAPLPPRVQHAFQTEQLAW
jgi:hypothetical protein